MYSCPDMCLYLGQFNILRSNYVILHSLEVMNGNQCYTSYSNYKYGVCIIRRVLASHAKGREFESREARNLKQ
jgi:hypothetical protein